MAVNEGSMKSFIRNFNDMLKSYQDNYGLDKNEAAALNDAHIRGAGNATNLIVGAGLIPITEGFLTAKGYQNKASTANENFINRTNEITAEEFGKLANSAYTANSLAAAALGAGTSAASKLPFVNMLASLPGSALATAAGTEGHDPIRIDKNDKRTYKEQLQSALRKINAAGGIPAAGTFNDSLNNSFLENLRNARSTKKSDIKEEPIRIIDKVQLPSVLNDLKSVKTIDTNILNDRNALREFLRSNGYK